MIIACWSGPRNISTALMNHGLQKRHLCYRRTFLCILFEGNKLKHPMHNEIIRSILPIIMKLSITLQMKYRRRKKSGIKNMYHHILNLEKIDWIKNCENCILLRHPKK